MRSRIPIVSLGLAFLMPFFPFQLAHQLHGKENAQANISSSWKKAKDAVDKLWKEPSSETAAEFYISISTGKGIENDKTELLDYIFGPNPKMMSSSMRVGSITMEMLSGDIYAARSEIRLLGFVYSGWQRPPSVTSDAAELILANLGMLVRVNPAIFLKACQAEQKDPYLRDNGFPVGFVSDIMKEIKTRASYELEMRKESLRSVEAPELRLVRDECLKVLEREIQEIGSDSPDSEKQEERPAVDPRARIKWVIAEMQRRPSPENMKRVLDLYSEVPRENLLDIILTLVPPPEAQRRIWATPLYLVRREALCGNEYAVEVLFHALVQCFGLESMQIYSMLSNFILEKPALFIEKLAKYSIFLDSIKDIGESGQAAPSSYIERICAYTSSFELPGINWDVILKRRIDTLAALNMPENQELIDRCIRAIQKELKDYIYKESGASGATVPTLPDE